MNLKKRKRKSKIGTASATSGEEAGVDVDEEAFEDEDERETDDTEDEDEEELDEDDEDDEVDDETDEVDEDEYEFNETPDDKENFNNIPASKKLEIEMLKRKLVAGNGNDHSHSNFYYHPRNFLADPELLNYHNVDEKNQLLNFMLKQQQHQQQKDYEKWLKTNMMAGGRPAAAQPTVDPVKQQKMSEVERIKQELIGYQRELELMQKKREYAKMLKQQQELERQQQKKAEVEVEGEEDRADPDAHLKHFHHHENPPFEPVNALIHENAIHSKPSSYKGANGTDEAQPPTDDSIDVAEMIKQFRLKEDPATPTSQDNKSINVQDKSN